MRIEEGPATPAAETTPTERVRSLPVSVVLPKRGPGTRTTRRRSVARSQPKTRGPGIRRPADARRNDRAETETMTRRPDRAAAEGAWRLAEGHDGHRRQHRATTTAGNPQVASQARATSQCQSRYPGRHESQLSLTSFSRPSDTKMPLSAPFLVPKRLRPSTGLNGSSDQTFQIRHSRPGSGRQA